MSDGLYKLQKHHLQDLLEKGQTKVFINGEIRTITKDDLVIKKEDVLKIEELLKKEKNK
jgi:hypothetical protein